MSFDLVPGIVGRNERKMESALSDRAHDRLRTDSMAWLDAAQLQRSVRVGVLRGLVFPRPNGLVASIDYVADQ